MKKYALQLMETSEFCLKDSTGLSTNLHDLDFAKKASTSTMLSFNLLQRNLLIAQDIRLISQAT